MKHTMSIPTISQAVIAIAIATASLFSLSTSAAFAQQAPQTADMTVTGTIVPAACSATFSNAEVDFGAIRLIDLPDNAYYRIPGTKDVTLNVNCNTGKRVVFAVTDTQATNAIADTAMYTLLGTAAAPAYVYGLGTATVNSSPVNLGSYAIQMLAPTVTIAGVSAARAPVYSLNNTAWYAANWMSKATAGFPTYSAGTTSTSVIPNGTAYQFPLRIAAALNYGSRLQVADNTRLNGQAVFAISYQ